MEWIPLTSYILNGVLVVVIVFMFIILRGMIATVGGTFDNYKRKNLTGREREDIRRRLIAQGMGAVHPHEVMDLIYSWRALELGQYTDEDPYVPQDDPYDDIEEF